MISINMRSLVLGKQLLEICAIYKLFYNAQSYPLYYHYSKDPAVYDGFVSTSFHTSLIPHGKDHVRYDHIQENRYILLQYRLVPDAHL